MSKDILNGESMNVNGTANLQATIDCGAKRFDFCYQISNWSYNANHEGYIEFVFDNDSDQCRVTFPIDENKEYQAISFDTTIEPTSVYIFFSGNYTVSNMELNYEATSVNTATTTTTGTVSPPATSSISIVEEDVTDDDGNVTAKAGDIDVKIGDGLKKCDDGRLTTTADLSGSNLQSVKFYTANGDQGMVVNGQYFFAKVNGGMKYLNGNRVIPVTADTSGVAAAYAAYVAAKQVAQQAEGGGNGGS